jgi:hypothetical protein
MHPQAFIAKSTSNGHRLALALVFTPLPLKHYLAWVWFNFEEGDVAGPPFGAPRDPGREGGSEAVRKWLMEPRLGCIVVRTHR